MLTIPIISSPSLVPSINFISNEIVTHTLSLETLCAAVPPPASIIEAIYPP